MKRSGRLGANIQGAEVDRIQVSLSREERRLLVSRCSLSEDWLSLLKDDEPGARTIVLAPSQVEALRTLVADRLQVAGFDEDWDVNHEGRLLEGVIDKLILRK